tara:strand:+ start:12645 stop:12992 length:348 start_codon:yes stop_codon:yes gene_type:complete|eukprot:GHVR01187993.1.p1 GENE.GHVR01187993.1~~GHVR01187993.1.p1  ORF type:complete len:116 (+),score=5.91 GHVR01187993.1:327-674(+)
MDKLPIYVFEGSIVPLSELLDEANLKYEFRRPQQGIVMASSSTIDVIMNGAFWVSLAGVLVAFIKSRAGRKVIITTKENTVIHAEGLTREELTQVLQTAKTIMAADTSPAEKISE